MIQLHRKFKYFGLRVPYLSKYDAQCFMKRFRKHLKNYSDEKISYYLVGEYGPVHFRPHFHVLFFFNDEKTLESFGKVLHKSWTFGRVDFSLSRSKCSNYVAKYVNCRNSVPAIFRDRAIRPFAIHSTQFAQGFYRRQKEKIYELSPNSFDVIMREVNGSTSRSYPWRSLVSLFFPKCRRFNSSNFDEILYTYKLLPTARKLYHFDSISQLSNQVLNDIIIRSVSYDDIFDLKSKKYKAKEFFLAFICNLLVSPENRSRYVFAEQSHVTLIKLRDSLASLFYLSNHFIEFCCNGVSDNEVVIPVLRKIVEFYSHQNYNQLCEQYRQQEILLNDFSDKDVASALFYFYDNTFEREYLDDDSVHYFVLNDYEVYLYKSLSSFEFYQDFLQRVNDNWKNSVKHKVLNDQNEIFCYDNNPI